MTSPPLALDDVAGRVFRAQATNPTAYMVQLTDRDGHVGIGVCPYHGRPDRTLDVLSGILSPRGVVPSMESTRRLALRGRTRTSRSVGTSLAMAWQDLTARQQGQPLGEWLGGTPAPVLTYANMHFDNSCPTPEEAAEEAEGATSRGHQELLVTPFGGAEERDRTAAGLERLRAIRDAVGPDVRLRVGLRGRLSVREIAALADDLHDLNIRVLHGVTSVADVRTLRAVREATGCRIATVSKLVEPARLREAVDLGVVDQVDLDVRHGPGPTWLLATLRALQDAGVQVGLFGPDGPVAAAFAGHVLSVLGGGQMQVTAAPENWRRAGVNPVERVPGGTWLPQRAPGIGLELNPRLWKPVGVAAEVVAS